MSIFTLKLCQPDKYLTWCPWFEHHCIHQDLVADNKIKPKYFKQNDIWLKELSAYKNH
jgi:hypothetical protein